MRKSIPIGLCSKSPKFCKPYWKRKELIRFSLVLWRYLSVFPRQVVRNPVVPRDITIQMSAAAQSSLLCLWVQCNQSEAQPPALRPFKIIGESPVKVSADVVSFSDK